jgi:hypothetical protein
VREDRFGQHRRVRPAKEQRKVGGAALDRPGDADDEEEAAAEGGKPDRGRVIGQQRGGDPFVERSVIRQFAGSDQALGIVDPHLVTGAARGRGQG